MRGLSRKQVSASRGLWVRVPRLPLARLENLRGSNVKATIGGRQFAKRVQNKNSPVVQRQRLLAYTQATMVRVHPGLLDHESNSRPRGAARSARQPVTLEIVGSNPIED